MSERWERRGRKLRAKRRRMPLHGKGMAEMYTNAVRKRLRELSERRRRMHLRKGGRAI